MTIDETGEWQERVAVCHAGGNDGADVYECQDFANFIWLKYGRELNDILNDMETHVMRRMGAAFDSELHCPYTGMDLFQWPLPNADAEGRWLLSEWMGYWRSDGWLVRIRVITREEQCAQLFDDWLNDNEAFKAWLKIEHDKRDV